MDNLSNGIEIFFSKKPHENIFKITQKYRNKDLGIVYFVVAIFLKMRTSLGFEPEMLQERYLTIYSTVYLFSGFMSG